MIVCICGRPIPYGVYLCAECRRAALDGELIVRGEN